MQRAESLGVQFVVPSPHHVELLWAPTPALRPTLAFGDVVVDPLARTVTRGGFRIDLGPKLLDLLLALLRRRGACASRADLLTEVWHRERPGTTRTVDTHVFELRRRLEPIPASPRYIITVSKVGYRLDM